MIPNELPQSLRDNPRLDRWCEFLPEGSIRISVGKVELGQGILTALSQIAAEELGVYPARVVMRSGDTDEAPDEGMTTGSQSLEVSGASLRLACAEIRGLFVGEAAAAAGCTPADLAVSDGVFVQNGSPTGLDYWTLAPRVSLARDATGSVAPRSPADYRVVGTSLPRLDLPAKIAGAGFIHDLAPLGMRHARVLRAPVAGSRVRAIDEAAITHRGVELLRINQFAALLADGEAALDDALSVARPVWDDAATTTGGDWLSTLPSDPYVFGAANALPSGEAALESTYSRPCISHGSIGPSCALAEWRDDHLTVWSHTQGVYPLRQTISDILGIALDAITVRHVQGAGCYGHNGADDVAVDAAVIAHARPGRPVRVLWRREDEFGHAPVSTAMRVHLAASVDADGYPLAWRTEIWSATHSGRGDPARSPAARELELPLVPRPPRENGPQGGGMATRNAEPAYRIRSGGIQCHIVRDPPVRTSALRSLGGLMNTFAIESFIDELADRACIDPIVYRLHLLDDPRARDVVARVAAMADWSARGPAGSGVGLGCGYGRYKNRSGYAAVIVEVEVDREVRLRRIWCAADAGLVVNPDGLRAQLEGGIIQAASMTLNEAVQLDGHVITSTNWDTYPILRFSEIPEITIDLIDRPDERPLGAGECTMGPTAGAIGNAVAHALGVRIRDMPLSGERIAEQLLGA